MRLMQKCFLLVCVGNYTLMHGHAVWSGASTPDVTDEDLWIESDCTLATSPTITINSGSYRALLPNTEATVTGSGYKIVINVASGATFTFDLSEHDNDLTFVGDAGANLFQIFQIGAGTVIFKLKGGRTLTFKGTSTTDAGVRYFCQLNHDALTPPVGLVWQYDKSAGAAAQNQNAVISLENSSMITFIARNTPDASTEEGGLGIYAANDTTYKGTLLFNIKDQAAFVATGHQFTGTDKTDLDVDLSTLAGKKTNVRLLYTTAGGTYTERFLVINSNSVLPQLFCDPTRTLATIDGVQHGFILGANSELNLQNGTYFDYVGTTVNCQSLTSSETILQGRDAAMVLKARNASALIIDGAKLDASYSTAQNIVMQDESGIFLRSACNKFGEYHQDVALTDAGLSFTITPTAQLSGAGNIVMDVEAALAITGATSTLATNLNTINVMSRETYATGGHIEIGGTLTTFPAFTFAQSATDSEEIAQYAKACIFINNRTNITNALIRHDDFIHEVNATNTPTPSEPTYIGGDTFKLVRDDSVARPTLALYNATARLHTSAAFTGVDLLVTPAADVANTSRLTFYQNGYELDNGTGRALVLGTVIGSYAYDAATIVDASSYLDIYQEVNTNAVTHQLTMAVSPNTSEWIQNITGDISTQYSVQTLFLGSESNIQIGSQSVPLGLTLTTTPHLYVDGNFFSFATHGGSIGQAELSATIGQGGIFVDRNGKLDMSSSARANFSVMVAKGYTNAIIDLPQGAAFFNDRVGIAHWDLNLALVQTVIAADQHLSNFTLDWMATAKDYAGGFVPFNPTGTLIGSVTAATLTNIPTVLGVVDQFQIKRSRLGDQAHVLINGGTIRGLMFLHGYDSAEAPTGLAVVKNNGFLGIGDNSVSRQSIEGNVVLGVNGLTIAADGNGVVELHTDIVVNNVCAILTGPNFGVTTANTLYIRSTDEREIRIKSGGTLDLTSFNTSNKELVFDGKVTLVMEPNSTLILSDNSDDGGVIYFDGQSVLKTDDARVPSAYSGTTIAGLDAYRAVIIGTGTIAFEDDAQLMIAKGSYLSIESNDTYDTDLSINVIDSAKFQIGTESLFGGAMQVGNTTNRATTVRLTFTLNGQQATLGIGTQGFFGIGAGIANKQASTPNNWYVGQLYNVTKFRLELVQGIINHSLMHKGSASEASLLAFGPTNNNYQLSIANIYNMSIYGGGNMINTTQFAPTTYSVLDASSDSVGVFASAPLLRDSSKIARFAALLVSGSAQNFFNVFKTEPLPNMSSPCASFASVLRAKNKMAYIFGNTIYRTPVDAVIGGSGQLTAPGPSLFAGAVGVDFSRSTGLINAVVEMIR